MTSSTRRFFRAVDKGIERSVPVIQYLMAGFFILVAAVLAISFSLERFETTGGMNGPWGLGLRLAGGLALLLAYLGVLAFVVAWATRRGWDSGGKG